MLQRITTYTLFPYTTLFRSDIDKHQGRRKQYKQLEKQLKESGEPQISTSDPDSKHMIVRNNITEVAYCIQSTVDAKNNIPIEDRKSTRLNSSHVRISYAVFC